MKYIPTKLLLLILFILTIVHTNAQTRDMSYSKSAAEYIFSWGNVDDPQSSVNGLNASIDADPVVRFSAFFNSQQQFHFDFSNSFGLYTGIGVRNIGFINTFNDSNATTPGSDGFRISDVKVKQRQYALGIPLALKLGSMSKNFYVAVGAELELFFNYKQKVFYNDSKQKYSEWFSSRSNLLNPSFFAEVNFPKGQFIRFRYYLNDFLKENSKGIDVSSAGSKLLYDSSPSELMYISIGTAIDWDDVFKKEAGKNNPLKAQLN